MTISLLGNRSFRFIQEAVICTFKSQEQQQQQHNVKPKTRSVCDVDVTSTVFHSVDAARGGGVEEHLCFDLYVSSTRRTVVCH